MKKINICLATLRNEFRLSGESQNFIHLKDGLRRTKMSVDFYTPLGVDISKTKLKKTKYESLFFVRFFKLIFLMFYLIINSRKYDVIHVNFPTPSFLIFGDIINIFSSSKVVVSFDSCLIDVPIIPLFIKSMRNDFLFYLSRIVVNNPLLGRLSLKLADSYVVSSNYQRKQLVKLGVSQRKVFCIPNMISDKNLVKKNRLVSRKRFGFKDEKVILYIGHFFHNKGLHLLFQAYSKLRFSPKTKLVIAWSGLGDIKKIDKLARKLNVSYKLLSEVDVASLISAADVMVLPYVYNFGTTIYPSILLESFAVGIPVVTSDISLTEDFTSLQKACFAFRREDVTDLKLKMEYFLNKTAKDREALNNLQRNYFKKYFLPHNSVLKYKKVYENLFK